MISHLLLQIDPQSLDPVPNRVVFAHTQHLKLFLVHFQKVREHPLVLVFLLVWLLALSPYHMVAGLALVGLFGLQTVLK